MQLSNQAILHLYSDWSEEFWCAGFMSPSEDTVRDFREWLAEQDSKPLEGYEKEMLEIYKRQEDEHMKELFE